MAILNFFMFNYGLFLIATIEASSMDSMEIVCDAQNISNNIRGRSFEYESALTGGLDICNDCNGTNCSLFGNNGSWSDFNQTYPDMGPPLYMYIYVTLLNAVVFVVGITGNVLVLQVVARTKSMHRRMNYFLVCLSVADLMVLLICPAVALLDFYGKERWYLGEAMCKIIPFLENMSHHCSVLTLLAIGFERYSAICHPLSVGQRFFPATTLIPIVWIVSIVVSVPFTIISKIEIEVFFDNSLVTVCRTDMKPSLSRVYILFIFSTFLVLPLVLLTIMYTAIIHTLAASSNNGLMVSTGYNGSCAPSVRSSVASVNLVGHACGTVSSVAGGRNNTSGLDADIMMRHARVISSRRQVVRMMCAVMALYFCCLMPMRIIQIWVVYSFEDFERLGFVGWLNVLNCARLLISLNSAGNPIIYGLLSSNFRSAFKKSFIISCRGKRKRGRGDWNYNNTYYTNSQHQHYLHQHTSIANKHSSPKPNGRSRAVYVPNRPNGTNNLTIPFCAVSSISLPVVTVKKHPSGDNIDMTVCTASEPLLIPNTVTSEKNGENAHSNSENDKTFL